MDVGWDPSQFLIPWTSWTPCGMRMEWSIPHGFHMECRHIHLGFHGISTGIPEKQPYLITKNSGNIENRTPASTKYHMINQMSTLSTALCNLQRYEFKLHKSCCFLATPKVSIGEPQHSICCRQQSTIKQQCFHSNHHHHHWHQPVPPPHCSHEQPPPPPVWSTAYSRHGTHGQWHQGHERAQPCGEQRRCARCATLCSFRWVLTSVLHPLLTPGYRGHIPNRVTWQPYKQCKVVTTQHTTTHHNETVATPLINDPRPPHPTCVQ